jgi:hypothetical protein
MFEKKNSVNINLVSQDKLSSMPQAEKLRFILDEVQAGKVLVLERGLTATEEAKLIEATMSEIDQNTFIGIEMQSYGTEKQSRLQKLLSGAKTARPRMAVIGPANLLKTIHKDSQQIQAQILALDGVVAPTVPGA